MKKLFVVLVAFVLVFAACSDGDGGNDETPPASTPKTTSLKINNQSFTEITDVVWNSVSFDVSQTDKSIKTGSGIQKNVQAGSGYIFFKRKTNPINARTRDLVVIAKDENIEFVLNDNTIIVDVDNPSRSGTLSALQPLFTTLKIKNESLVEITDVIWNNVSFANNQYENSIKPGTAVTNTVQPGAGYIFFKRKANPIIAHTNNMVIIKKNDDIEFIFTDNTSIVEINNPGNNGTLVALQSTVVWWDDAEGAMQPYTLKQNFVGYYTQTADLLNNSYNFTYFYPPKNGSKSLAIGGTNTALLHLRINLTKNAKLSFWYANRFNGNMGTIFSINDEEKEKWITDINWSFLEFDLEPGMCDLKWEKKDGTHDVDYFGPRAAYNYLSLDDILIYYTE